MAATDALAVFDSLIGVFEQMSIGNALGVQVREIARCLHLVRREVPWTPGHAVLASRLRAAASLYATRFVRPEGSEGRRKLNEARLDEVRAIFTGLRNLLHHQAAEEGAGLGGPVDPARDSRHRLA